MYKSVDELNQKDYAMNANWYELLKAKNAQFSIKAFNIRRQVVMDCEIDFKGYIKKPTVLRGGK